MRLWRTTLAAAVALVAVAATPSPAQQTSAWPSGRQLDLVFPIKDLNFTVDDIGGQPKDVVVEESKTEIRIDLAADVLFDFDKWTLRPSARDALHQVAAIVRANAKGGIVRVDGYTDSKGSDAYNQRLSNQRAESVRSWLVSEEGLRDVKFKTEGFGAGNPVAPNTNPDGSDSPEGRQKNRRVEIIIAKG